MVHFESGLGNQMLCYAEYLYMKEQSGDRCYGERLVYEIPSCGERISQWNGYELDRIFGIAVADIQSVFSPDQYKAIVSQVEKSRFWEDGWRYDQAILRAFAAQGLVLENYTMPFETGRPSAKKKLTMALERSCKGYAVWTRKRRIKAMEQDPRPAQRQQLLIQAAHSPHNAYCGQTLTYMYRLPEVSQLDEALHQAFQFPPFADEKNRWLARTIAGASAVAIHARRGDFLSHNGVLYTGGYFKKAVEYIKSQVQQPLFLIFCDPGSMDWCRKNSKIFSLDLQKDRVLFVDWNQGKESFRDMQLMSLCKHNIITSSSFGWWGAFLNAHPEKITISPDPRVRTTMWL